MRFGKKSKIRLSKPFIDEVIHEASTMLLRKGFFENAPYGANMLNGFIGITRQAISHSSNIVPIIDTGIACLSIQ